MFHSAALKLTLWYLAIIMAISLIFSISLYQVSSADLGRNVNRQIGYFTNLLAPEESNNYRQLRNRQLDQDLRHLKANLVLFNLLVLLSGGAASYWLARRTLEPIEKTLDSQTRFAADASHELRTPLTAMMTENEVALRSKNMTKAEAVELLKSNLEEAAKLKSLAEGLLRLSNGGLVDKPQVVSLKTVSETAISRFEKAAGAKKISLKNEVPDINTLGDADSLTELVAIFLDNAVKYSPRGSQIKLSGGRRHKNVFFKVADNGAGISRSELPHIFERFYRTDSARSKNSGGGYGLGLAIAQKIAEAHNGHIEVSSTVGKGTVFSVFLPPA
jgi:signal transduction histidine kinase